MRTEKEIKARLKKQMIRITSDEKYGYDKGFRAGLEWVLEVQSSEQMLKKAEV